jgi:hypothetical protein
MHAMTTSFKTPNASRSDDASELDRAYRELLIALGGDTATLEQRVADRCTVIGPKGFLISKPEWIDAHSGHVYEQVALDSLERDVQVYGDTAVCVDLQHSECLFKGQLITGLFRVLSVWTRHESGWQLVAIQYTSVAPEAAPNASGQ